MLSKAIWEHFYTGITSI